MLLSLCSSALLGYLIGSFPTAYLLVRWKKRIDIREAGSGNVGTLNSYVVTRSKAIALVVLVGDSLKGALAVVLARQMLGDSLAVTGAAGIAVVLGHNFPIILGFRGGRGLAPAAGAILVIAWPVLPFWLLLWALGYAVLREVNLANGAASLICLLVFVAGPDAWITAAFGETAPVGGSRVFGAVLMIAILTKLAGPIREWIRGSQGNR